MISLQSSQFLVIALIAYTVMAFKCTNHPISHTLYSQESLDIGLGNILDNLDASLLNGETIEAKVRFGRYVPGKPFLELCVVVSQM